MCKPASPLLGVDSVIGDVVSSAASIAIPVVGATFAVAAVVEFVMMNAVILATAAAVFVVTIVGTAVAMRTAVMRAGKARQLGQSQAVSPRRRIAPARTPRALPAPAKALPVAPAVAGQVVRRER